MAVRSMKARWDVGCGMGGGIGGIGRPTHEEIFVISIEELVYKRLNQKRYQFWANVS